MTRVKHHDRPVPAPTNEKRIICVETGREFRSVLQAAKEMQLAHSSISAHLHERHGYAKVHGFTFKLSQ